MTSGKSDADRVREMVETYTALTHLGLGIDHEDVLLFKKIASAFVRDGTTREGRIPLRGVGRDIVYCLSSCVPSRVFLTASKRRA